MRQLLKIFFVFLIFCNSTAKAQLDLEHWFPPLYKSGPNTFDNNIRDMYLYLSTEKTTPFIVKIFNNNQVIGTVTLSKSSPVKYEIQNMDSMLSTSPLNTMKPSNMGLHVTGEKSFYASLRINGSSSDVMASKGKSGLGTEFFTGMEQVILYGYDRGRMNYQISVMATKDNTHVKLSNFADGIIFIDGSKPKELNFTLNKGESYMIVQQKSDVNPQMQFDDYEPDLIGAKVTSDQPIIVNSGNISSHYFGDGPPFPAMGPVPDPFNGGADFTVDQDLPTSKIGKEYFLITGMTPARYNDNNPKAILATERALIIATKNNTKIYFNDESSPTKTLNAGEHFFTLPYTPPKYILGNLPKFTNSAGREISTSGMYIHTSDPVYIYQLIGGFWDRSAQDKTFYATGMLFSYPIDKNYLSDPRQKLENLVQIPDVDKINNTGYETKISVKAPTNANVKFNGLTPPKSPMIGKEGWSYFSASLLGGTVNVTSDLGINVDVVGGRKFTGFGSSYTGFSNDPFILVNGSCIQEEVLLSLNNIDFEGFQWQLNGVDIPGANSPSYIPLIAGSYTCVLSYSGFTFTTDPVIIKDCPYVLTTNDLGSLCPNFPIIPKFSPPNENLVFTKIEILTQPNYGTAVIDNNQIKITNNVGFTGNDRFVYKMTAANGFYEVVKVNFSVFAGPIGDVKSEILNESFEEPNYIYDLNSAINNTNGETFHFYLTQSDAENEINEIYTTLVFKTENPTEVFVKIISANGCILIKKVILLKRPPENVDEIKLPNVFTPNNDGFNDVWDYSLLKETQNLKLMIFDRFGEKVYERKSDSDDYFWDGKNEIQRPLPIGTYWVTYSYNVKNSPETISKSMWILLKNRN